MAAIMQKVGWRFTLAASGVAGWYTYYLYSGSDPSLNVKISDTVVKTVVGAFGMSFILFFLSSFYVFVISFLPAVAVLL